MAWATTADARAIWPDAPAGEDTLAALLRDATYACAAYAPALADPDLPPPEWGRAVVLQAREMWAAARRDGDLIGTDSYAVRARPLTGTVRALLRPRRGAPKVR